MSKCEHVMVDLETLSTKPNALIVSIGAVSFNSDGIGQKFYVPIDMGSYGNRFELGAFDIDPNTVAWWMGQTEEGREVFKDTCAMDLARALREFSDWIDKEVCDTQDVKVWGNGASFDNVILKNAYNRCAIKEPWRHWNDRCYRTVKNMCSLKMKRHGTYHNALDDAISQAQHLVSINQYAMDVFDV